MSRYKYDGVECVDCDQQAVCDDRCGACYKWRRSRIANLTRDSKDAERYFYRLSRTVRRVRKYMKVYLSQNLNVRRHTVAANGRRRHNHLGAAA